MKRPRESDCIVAPNFDPAISGLFSSSLGPAITPAKTAGIPEAQVLKTSSELRERHEKIQTLANDSASELDHHDLVTTDLILPDIASAKEFPLQSRKRRRKEAEVDVEGKYFEKLTGEEVREKHDHAKVDEDEAQAKASRIHRTHASEGPDGSDVETENESAVSDESETPSEKDVIPGSVPQHESLATSQETDIERAARTVFLANVSTAAIRSKTAKKSLIGHLESISLSSSDPSLSAKVESIRFRSTPFSDGKLPKKAAFVKKELMDSTAKSTNAYVVYKDAVAARMACKTLNGSLVLERHIRVDSVAHPAKQDHRRCVFVGNLGFVDDDSAINKAAQVADGRRPSKPKQAADYEEGLWRTFDLCGKVESVRIIRDKTTRVGKGFAYVQFENANAVEKALAYNDKRFPPMLPRNLRVVRAKKTTASAMSDKRPQQRNDRVSNGRKYDPKISSKAQSYAGRAGKLLGRAEGAKIQQATGKMPANATVFEGKRASARDPKTSASSKKSGKPQGRRSQRAADFKKRSKS